MIAHSSIFAQLPFGWSTERAKWLVNRQRRAAKESEGVVTAFRDGQVTLRANRRLEGFTEAVQEIGYQGIRAGDLVVHGMDAFAGAIGVSDSDGKASPVVHAYTPQTGVDIRYIAYTLRLMALSGHLSSLAKGIRERSTSFDSATMSNLHLPVPPEDDQQRIADYLDIQLREIDKISASYHRRRKLTAELTQATIDETIGESEDLVPLRYMVRFREGPGIMADDFRDEGVPLIRVSGLQDGQVTLGGCNFLDPQKVDRQWSQFKLRLDDRLISGSATMGEVSVVRDTQIIGAIPYTGLIILRPATPDIDMQYIEVLLKSSQFMRQIDALKTGAAMQHFGPSHLSQIKAVSLGPRSQRIAVSKANEAIAHSTRVHRLLDVQLRLLQHRRLSLISTAVTGQFDVSAASGRGVTE